MLNKLVIARRLLLAELSGDPDARAAWAVLPADWERAVTFLPQDDEPSGVPSFRGADMLLTASAGYLAEIRA
ncbi:hypothetical protein GCM10023264_25190 [Sphingomonas daechungensis]|uniref:Uncharacterized protein n=1 Tax=Sphingomonas daechungensis TaxID=1176646 RepID=A0ABX6T0Y4_9SPHN|nr:hypothetical protein [Sphingomonas daechungensis]QNP43506.1 hypothetical protein H9L15_01585 [Sphingomonas daechungensis]